MSQTSYTISELAAEFDVTTRTIRFYEEKGYIHPRRDGQKRVYSPADRVRIKLILRGKRLGMSLEESVEIIDLYQGGANTEKQLAFLLERIDAHRSKLLQQRRDINATLSRLQDVKQSTENSLHALQTNTTG